MDQRLLSNDYESITNKIKTLSQDIQNVQRQRDLIGTMDDTATFRKQLTAKIQSTSKLVMSIKSALQRAKENAGADTKWKKLESQFFQNFERLRNITNEIGTKFKQTEPRQPQQKDKLLDKDRNNNDDYGTSWNGQQSQEQLFKPYDDLYELENYEEALFEILQNLELLYESHKDLNMMIYDQDEVVEQLHDNVANARDNVQQGVQHLDKAQSHQKAYRGKLCIFLLVLLIIAIIVTLVILLNRK